MQPQLQSDSTFRRSIYNVGVPPIFVFLQNSTGLDGSLSLLWLGRSDNDPPVFPFLLLPGHRVADHILGADYGLFVVGGLVLERLVVAFVEDAVAHGLRLLGFLLEGLLLLLQLVVDLSLLLFERLILLGRSTTSHVDTGKIICGLVVVFGDVENLVIGRLFPQEEIVFHFIAILLFLRRQLHFGRPEGLHHLVV